MTKNYDRAVMMAVALCLKPYLKPEEAMIYLNLGRTRLASKCAEYGIYKNSNGYYKREDLDLILSGSPSKLDEKASNITLQNKRHKGQR